MIFAKVHKNHHRTLKNLNTAFLLLFLPPDAHGKKKPAKNLPPHAPILLRLTIPQTSD